MSAGMHFRKWFGLTLVLAAAGAAALAQSGLGPVAARSVPTYVVPGESQVSTLYADGSQIVIQTEQRWKLMCGSAPVAGVDDLRTWATHHQLEMQNGPVRVIDTPNRNRAIDIIFNAGPSVPTEAEVALGIAEAYLESLFADTITVSINVSFQAMGGGVIGSTAPSYVNGVSYTNSRNGLINGMDRDDVIQDWLPSGNTVPVRFDGSSGTISQVSSVKWTRAAYRATIGSVTGLAADMTYNTNFDFDYDPSNGVPGNLMSFVDVVCHEVGHALGFVSSVDFGANELIDLDLYRFPLTDTGNDWNPDTFQEFQTKPRLMDFNNPDDGHISDIITGEYRMEDGSPAQGSHFREQGGSLYIGLMDPYFTEGETHYPDYFTLNDLAMFDAIGYDYPNCLIPLFTQQPQSQVGCVGGLVQFTVAVDLPNCGFQWYRGVTQLVDDGVHISGATTATLTITNIDVGDVSTDYHCFVTNLDDGCTSTSDNATLGVITPVTITTQPQDRTVLEGANVNFSVTATGEPPLTYQWRRYGVNLVNGGNIFGATSASLAILAVSPNQAGDYDVVVTNACGPVVSNTVHLTVSTGYGSGPGDMDCSNSVGFSDINAFVLALSGGEANYYGVYPDCHWWNADINSNGVVGFDDINPFVALLAGGQ